MRRYLIDNTPLVGLLNNRPTILGLVDPWLEEHEAATSIVVYGEAVEHIMGDSRFDELHASLLGLLREVAPYPLNLDIMRRYAALRRFLRPPYGPGLIGDVDTIIAATALEYELTVVTTDRHFARVPELEMLLLDRATLLPVSST